MYNIFIAWSAELSYSAALERQQLEADVRKLTKEKKDLLDQLKDYKDDLKAKDECEIVTVYTYMIYLYKLSATLTLFAFNISIDNEGEGNFSLPESTS